MLNRNEDLAWLAALAALAVSSSNCC